MTLFTHHFTVGLKIQLWINDCPKVFVRLHTLHCFTLNGCDFMHVSAYTQKCMEDVSTTKIVTTRANQKPWMTNEVCAILTVRNAAFKSGDRDALRSASANLNCAIRTAKRENSGILPWPNKHQMHMARHPDHHRLQGCFFILWEQHRLPQRTQ